MFRRQVSIVPVVGVVRLDRCVVVDEDAEVVLDELGEGDVGKAQRIRGREARSWKEQLTTLDTTLA